MGERQPVKLKHIYSVRHMWMDGYKFSDGKIHFTLND